MMILDTEVRPSSLEDAIQHLEAGKPSEQGMILKSSHH